jgi:hypothetical protein
VRSTSVVLPDRSTGSRSSATLAHSARAAGGRPAGGQGVAPRDPITDGLLEGLGLEGQSGPRPLPRPITYDGR